VIFRFIRAARNENSIAAVPVCSQIVGLLAAWSCNPCFALIEAHSSRRLSRIWPPALLMPERAAPATGRWASGFSASICRDTATSAIWNASGRRPAMPAHG